MFSLLQKNGSSQSHDPAPHPLSTNTSLSTNDESSRILADPSPPLSSATEVLHEFPAVYIGSTTCTGKSSDPDTLIERVLMDSRPSLAKIVSVSLSLMEVRYTLDKGGVAGGVVVGGVLRPSTSTEKVFLSHDTSRIRTMGTYSEDQRFAGYVIKEEGRPMMGHVIKCNSAALMVSFASFLRQSCQLTAHQRGGAFYEELSTDESGDWGTSFEVSIDTV